MNTLVQTIVISIAMSAAQIQKRIANVATKGEASQNDSRSEGEQIIV